MRKGACVIEVEINPHSFTKVEKTCEKEFMGGKLATTKNIATKDNKDKMWHKERTKRRMIIMCLNLMRPS